MRPILTWFALVSALAWGGDGRPPRASAADYPVQHDIKGATIATVRIPAAQLNKTFPADLARKYIVLEVAIYPKDGASTDVAMRDFALKLGADGLAHPDTASDVAWMWRAKGNSGPELKGNTHVTTETGVIVASGENPNTGQRRGTSVGTYEGVGVSNYPNQGPPIAPGSGVDADRMEEKLKSWALPEGKATSPIAGYLYFPLPSKKIKGALVLQYAHDDSSVDLTLPAK